jgi:hypothetical protein
MSVVAAAIIGSAVVGAVAAEDAQDAQWAAQQGQISAINSELELSKDQWKFAKETYLPKAMENADAQLAMSQKLTNAQIADADYYRGMAGEQFNQAKKSFRYQDEFMKMTDDYLNGNAANREADMANADVEQAYAASTGDMMRTMGRYGINPGSPQFASTLSDMALQHAANKAGAQTQARTAARQRAEQMVAIAAGSGAQGFGTGLNAGQLGINSTANAANTNAASGNGLAQVANTYGAGLSRAGTGFSQVAKGWNNFQNTYQGNLEMDYWQGLLKSFGTMGMMGGA